MFQEMIQAVAAKYFSKDKLTLEYIGKRVVVKIPKKGILTKEFEKKMHSAYVALGLLEIGHVCPLCTKGSK